ncbi:hypothetical protein BC835DRAFT_1491070 [Cytidiella melzeri]|nr:hypothetical protein BC835DRAFT_1491070 [Cytidiella melzeri]
MQHTWDSSESGDVAFHVLAPELTAPPLLDSLNSRLDAVLQCMQSHNFTLGGFLVELFRAGSDRTKKKTQRHTQMVSSFLDGRSKQYDAISLVKELYNSRHSTTRNHESEEFLARNKLQQWAVEVVEDMVSREAEELASKEGGLRLAGEMTWEFATQFSLAPLARAAWKMSPTCIRVLAATAISKEGRKKPPSWFAQAQSAPQLPSATTTRATQSGQGKNRRDPWVIVIIVFMMLLNARNLRFTVLQKLMGVWLFANSAARGVYDVLGRIGLSVAYSTTLELLRGLLQTAQSSLRTEATRSVLSIVYDNINRKREVWDAEYGERAVIDSGTVATAIILEDCEPEIAFNIAALEQARAKRLREQLTVEVLLSRIDQGHLNRVLAVHVVSFLVMEFPHLSHFQPMLNNKLRTELATHRMRKGRRTQAFPMAASEHDEGSTEGNRKVIDDLLLNQLGLKKDEVKRMLTIVTGDQSTIEKIRTLKRFLDSCPHGYHQYGWVLPLIQLWHMGWSDLERILDTHWGPKSCSKESEVRIEDVSTFSFVNELLGRKVKNMKRPDYYPAQALVFDTLRAEVLECWREHYQTDDLGVYMVTRQPTLDELLQDAQHLVNTYLTTASAECALHGRLAETLFSAGSQWTSPFQGSSAPAAPRGDQVLANTILRMRDSMLHYEFQSAIADGDIGRAMNVMAVWVFTFCGSGRSKYTNELLEVACNFEYEYSNKLKTAIMNNWLCNLTGDEGRWFPMDLMQEHNINLLKSMSGSRSSPFADPFFKEVISLNIHNFLDIKESLRTAVGIGAKSGSHKQKKKAVALRHLRNTMREHELHKFRASRTFGFMAQDDFAAGYDRFDYTSRIEDFVQRTLADMGNLHGVEEVDNEDALEADFDAPRPSIWQDGELVLGTDVEDEDDNVLDEQSTE